MIVSKLTASLNSGVVHYDHPYYLHSLNSWVGQSVRLQWSGSRVCIACERSANKLYQGHCYVCSQRLACCDLCILKPETCHYHLGTCREPQWGLSFCMQQHIIYLSLTSCLKVGITRATQIPTRWIDQGALWAVPLGATYSRYHAGLLEVEIAKEIGDKTNWRDLLTGKIASVESREEVAKALQDKLALIAQEKKLKVDLSDLSFCDLSYPVEAFLPKAKTVNLEKNPLITDRLIGIKGQYLLFENEGGLNMRKYTGYDIFLELEGESHATS